jgi:hypothetical protein
MPPRPVSAPVARSVESPPKRLLKLTALLKDEHLPFVGDWWSHLPIVQRACGRWVFEEPEGLPWPRQRARRNILDVPQLDDLDLPEETMVERHNKCQHFKPVKGEALEQWKGFCLKTTNQEFQKVPEPDLLFGPAVWMRMFRKSHGGLLRPGALDLVAAWQPTSTQRQRAALSELLWSFTDHLTARRGRTETKIQYGPKQGEQASISLVDPFASALGRPSSAPIAHAVQRKFEQQQREAEAKMLAVGRAACARRKARGANEKREVRMAACCVLRTAAPPAIRVARATRVASDTRDGSETAATPHLKHVVPPPRGCSVRPLRVRCALCVRCSSRLFSGARQPERWGACGGAPVQQRRWRLMVVARDNAAAVA